ncbi:para-aminobenzoate synthetase component 1 [Aquiflexum balticum DSM 16537]|uniref:Para-aminobenzoate synthetase component 1 n=1 Tax=Aquiflexum balticum DSM 16537 TaxID=758820 RepID=A0A1W2H623_9BACT|nr:anthranilate synthase component I family protein [Aquiflexum balticum]SMD44387.1 para-aminobenzoate synthetase component 1 [Aquiflexum balticum DSM 16537]
MSTIKEFQFSSNHQFLRSLLCWADHHYTYTGFFDHNDIEYPYGGFQRVLMAAHQGFDLEIANQWFGKKEMAAILSYDYKNNIEKLKSNNRSLVDCPESIFFIPEIKIEILVDHVRIYHADPQSIFDEICALNQNHLKNPSIEISALTSRNNYFENVKDIQNNIVEGDMYELNYCLGFEFESKNWNPIEGFFDLMGKSPMPFSAFFKAESKYLICASPERFLKKTGDKLIAQPIKGTIKRGKNELEDSLLKEKLLNSEKERAENLMIVDLMRNDLSRISQTGSVKVEELFGVYPFSRVHQMISTVVSTISEKKSLMEILHATFPMGSMTGAPKIKCMELIDQYEDFKRGWFSGALGYIDETGNFDLCVVIRSIILDKESGKGYFAVGSAITYDADAAYEYEECLLKASAIVEVLQGN